MQLSEKIKKLFEAEIEIEVEKRMKEMPVRLEIDNVEIDIDSVEIDGGEMLVKISKPFYQGGEIKK